MAAIDNDWLPAVNAEFKKPYYAELYKFVKEEYSKTAVFPPSDEIFSALHLTPLSKVKATSPSQTSTVLMFTVKHEAGSLANAIGIIGQYGYNMTALCSRPMRKHSWQYYFYVEIDGTTETENGANMIRELNKVCDQLKVAGTFFPHTEI